MIHDATIPLLPSTNRYGFISILVGMPAKACVDSEVCKNIQYCTEHDSKHVACYSKDLPFVWGVLLHSTRASFSPLFLLSSSWTSHTCTRAMEEGERGNMRSRFFG